MKDLISSILLVLCCSSAFAQTTALWMRYPAISPDGRTIAFGYKGDIYTVSADGGVATPLTIHEAHDMMPIWSHDGKHIAFASDRYGNFDVFIIPSTGGTPVRLTSHSSADYPCDFSPDDKQVLFNSARESSAGNIRFYSPRLFMNLYTVSVNGGRPVLVTDAGTENAHYNKDGSKIVFQDRKGYEDQWRKHHTSSVTRDIWVMDVKDKKFTQISSFVGEDREPVWDNNDANIYFLSEKSGSMNVYTIPASGSGGEKQLTSFSENPVRALSISNDNTLCFTYNGSIYTKKAGRDPQKLTITIMNDGRQNIEKNLPVTGNVGQFAVSPNGREIAFITRGEVFVTSVDGSQTKRITNTPQQERSVQWTPDGRSLIYAAERGKSWDIYQTTLARKEETYFFNSTTLAEEPLIATDAEEFQPKVSPDGKEIAYLENRNVLRVYNIASKKTRTILPEGHNYSYADGDIEFEWSPDSKYILTEDEGYSLNVSHAAIVKADGSENTIQPILSGYGEGNLKWAMDGKMISWTNGRDGKRSAAIQGASEDDIYAVFLDRASYDRFKLSNDEYNLLKETEDKDKKDKDKATDSTKTAKKDGKKDKGIKASDSTKKAFIPDFTELADRKVRLTINSSNISDYAISADGSRVYYLAAFEKGYDLWVTNPRTRDTKILAKLGGSPSGIEMSADGKYLLLTNNGSLVKIDTTGKQQNISIAGEMILNTAAEREYMFEHCWRQVKAKFYDPKLHGVNWEEYKKTYSKFLPHINNNYDYQDLLGEMLGELNASHTGGRYNAGMHAANTDATATLGLLYDETYTGSGLLVTEVIAGGPLTHTKSKVKIGTIIEKIDGNEINDNADWASLLNRKAGKNTLLSVFDPKSNTRWDEVVKPISMGEESNLMYKRWVKKMTDLTDKLSGGKVGYVHVQGMNDGSYRTVIDEAMGKNRNKEALIVDTRFNGGGWLHNDLVTFLSGSSYMRFAPQGHEVPTTEPVDRWKRPSCVLMSEGNYSDAFMFPYAYKQNNLGKLVGMPVAGTGTAVWWETQIDPSIVFGIPMIASIGKENRPTENLQLEPDIRVPLPYEHFLFGKDDQLEAAVKLMLETIKK